MFWAHQLVDLWKQCSRRKAQSKCEPVNSVQPRIGGCSPVVCVRLDRQDDPATHTGRFGELFLGEVAKVAEGSNAVAKGEPVASPVEALMGETSGPCVRPLGQRRRNDRPCLHTMVCDDGAVSDRVMTFDDLQRGVIKIGWRHL